MTITKIIKSLKEMNIFERVFALLIDADELRIFNEIIDTEIIYKSSTILAFHKLKNDTFSLGKFQYSDVEYENEDREIVIGYRCPICHKHWIENHYNNINGIETFKNCHNEEVFMDAPFTCYNCMKKDVLMSWNDRMVFWTEEELLEMQKVEDENNE